MGACTMADEDGTDLASNIAQVDVSSTEHFLGYSISDFVHTDTFRVDEALLLHCMTAA
jgi:hypothetical protein